jgi:hypothetical protein
MLEFGEEAEESLALSLSKLGLGGLVEAEVEVRWGSRRRGKWRSMNRLLPLPGPVLATTEVASAEEQEMLMVGRPSLLCTPLRSIDAMDGCRSLWELWVWLVARCSTERSVLAMMILLYFSLSLCAHRRRSALLNLQLWKQRRGQN